jgi:hypothetical protein
MMEVVITRVRQTVRERERQRRAGAGKIIGVRDFFI